MKEAKPICVIYLPLDFVLGGNNKYNAPLEMMKALNGNFGDSDNNVKYTDYWKDYYWFSFYKNEITEPEFKVFYVKDFTEIEMNELKGIVLNAINDTVNKEKK